MNTLRLHKKWITLILVASLILPAFYVQFWFVNQRHLARKEVKRMIKSGLRESELEVFVFSEEETETKLRWEHSKEFEYKGEMYDIIRRDTVNDSLSYWVWHDTQETFLNQQHLAWLDATLRGNVPFKNTKSQFSVFLKTLYYSNSTANTTFAESHANRLKTPFKSPLIEELSASPPSPPPQVL